VDAFSFGCVDVNLIRALIFVRSSLRRGSLSILFLWSFGQWITCLASLEVKRDVTVVYVGMWGRGTKISFLVGRFGRLGDQV